MLGDNIIEIKGISKTFEDNKVLDNITLGIKKNEFITLLGPSGCGKTTTLKILAGFETCDEGEVIFEDKKINDLPPYERQINTVFQKYALFPHMNVYENIAFGLKIKKLSKSEIDKKVNEVLKLVDLKGFEKRKIESLSGGQQQRVAIARAIVNEPKVLLLDEPLGALDLKLRKEMQIELKRIQKQLGITFVFVTHDQDYANELSDLINSYKLNSKVIQRKNSFVIYLKEGEQIVDLLNIIGAHNALLELENIRIMKEMRNNVNRIVNCETANLSKTVNAAVRQVESIKLIESEIGLDRLPKNLKEVAKLRLAFPDESLKELGAMLNPPVGKSGVNHRLRRIEKIADELRKEGR